MRWFSNIFIKTYLYDEANGYNYDIFLLKSFYLRIIIISIYLLLFFLYVIIMYYFKFSCLLL